MMHFKGKNRIILIYSFNNYLFVKYLQCSRYYCGFINEKDR